MTITVSYVNLHRQRFGFFRSMLEPLDVHWEGLRSELDPALNEGQPFTFGTARLKCGDEASLNDTLESIGSHIVFLIDWNRAHRRLLSFVGRDAVMSTLQEAAHIDAGRMAWLKCGGEAFIHDVTQVVSVGVFRIGDRFDTVLGAVDICRFPIDVLRLASRAIPND